MIIDSLGNCLHGIGVGVSYSKCSGRSIENFSSAELLYKFCDF